MSPGRLIAPSPLERPCRLSLIWCFVLCTMWYIIEQQPLTRKRRRRPFTLRLHCLSKLGSCLSSSITRFLFLIRHNTNPTTEARPCSISHHNLATTRYYNSLRPEAPPRPLQRASRVPLVWSRAVVSVIFITRLPFRIWRYFRLVGSRVFDVHGYDAPQVVL